MARLHLVNFDGATRLLHGANLSSTAAATGRVRSRESGGLG
jgi:hypothetical protein